MQYENLVTAGLVLVAFGGFFLGADWFWRYVGSHPESGGPRTADARGALAMSRNLVRPMAVLAIVLGVIVVVANL
jgi:hypothetical protein